MKREMSSLDFSNIPKQNERKKSSTFRSSKSPSKSNQMDKLSKAKSFHELNNDLTPPRSPILPTRFVEETLLIEYIEDIINMNGVSKKYQFDTRSNIFFRDTSFGYTMSPNKQSHELLYGRQVSTGDPETYRTIAQNYEYQNGVTNPPQKNSQFHFLRRHSKSSASVNDEHYDPSQFQLHPAENRFVFFR